MESQAPRTGGRLDPLIQAIWSYEVARAGLTVSVTSLLTGNVDVASWARYRCSPDDGSDGDDLHPQAPVRQARRESAPVARSEARERRKRAGAGVSAS